MPPINAGDIQFVLGIIKEYAPQVYGVVFDYYTDKGRMPTVEQVRARKELMKNAPDDPRIKE